MNKLKLRTKTIWNYAYFPIIFESESNLLKIETKLKQNGILPRRYFYPSLEALPYVNSLGCHIALDVAKRVLCLPLYFGLEQQKLKNIVELINQNLY